jgi:hypothetical protein
MNIEDLKKITDMALANADQNIAYANENKDISAKLQAIGVLCFASSILMDERINMVINFEQEKTNDVGLMLDMLNKKRGEVFTCQDSL